jgi:hypothetical protein
VTTHISSDIDLKLCQELTLPRGSDSPYSSFANCGEAGAIPRAATLSPIQKAAEHPTIDREADSITATMSGLGYNLQAASGPNVSACSGTKFAPYSISHKRSSFILHHPAPPLTTKIEVRLTTLFNSISSASKVAHPPTYAICHSSFQPPAATRSQPFKFARSVRETNLNPATLQFTARWRRCGS